MGTIILVASRPDIASMNIRDKLLKLGIWSEKGEFGADKILWSKDYALVTIDELHLNRNNIDRDFIETTGIVPVGVIYLSKHRSDSNMRSLTVHPIGCFGKAEFGGKDRTLVESNPRLMTAALRILKKEAKEIALNYNISFEASHHGPYLETPTFFIEIGSSEKEWSEEKPAEAIAKTLLSISQCDDPVAIGIGGGHYAPRHTDLATERKVAFGHIIPSYAIENIDEALILQCIEKTKGVKIAYLHRKAMKKPDVERLTKWFESHGLQVFREKEIKEL